MCTDQAGMTDAGEVALAVSLELATAKWKVALHDGRRDSPAIHTVAQVQAAARLQAVLSLIEQHRHKWALPASTRVVVSYEAGQDAFWICRALQAREIECHVVDPAAGLRISGRRSTGTASPGRLPWKGAAQTWPRSKRLTPNGQRRSRSGRTGI